MIPTLLGILLINFIIVQAAPGGPVEQLVVKLTTADANSAASRMGGGGELANTASVNSPATASGYRGAQGIDPEILADIKRQ